MNPANKKLLKGIKIFFKTLYIVTLIFFIFSSLGAIPILINKSGTGPIPIVFIEEQPDLNLEINGKPIEAADLSTIGIVEVTGAPFGIRFFSIMLSLSTIFCFVIILRKIRLIIKSISQNELFTLENAARLRIMGWLLLVAFLASNAMLLFLNINSVEFTFKGKFMAFSMIFGDSVGYLVAMVFIFFMAAVFKIGVNMQEENKSFV